jgi:hypothetical protein
MGYQGQRIHVMNHKQKTRTTRFVWGKL